MGRGVIAFEHQPFNASPAVTGPIVFEYARPRPIRNEGPSPDWFDQLISFVETSDGSRARQRIARTVVSATSFIQR
jgi:hypothetical protein